MRSIQFAIVVAVAAATAALGLGHAPSAHAAGLTLRSGDAPGLKRVKASPQAARRAVARGMGRRAARIVRRSRAQSAAFRRKGWSLRSHAFRTRGAARALAGWPAAHRRARWKLRRVRIGAGGWLAQRSTRRGAQYALAWRYEGVLSVIELPRGRGGQRRALIAGYARLAQLRLRRELTKTAWDRVLDRIRPGRPVSTKTALQAFSLAYGRLPGVRLPRGRRPRIGSGTHTIEWVLERWRQLTPAQKAGVQRALGTRIDAAGLARASRAADPPEDPGFTPDPASQKTADAVFADYGRRMGFAPALPLVVGKTDKQIPGARADASPLHFAAGEPLKCRIRLTPNAFGRGDVDLRVTIAHEVFHCTQYQILGTGKAGGRHRPGWLTEGLASWASIAVNPGGYDAAHRSDFYDAYLLSQDKQLFTRAYDAVGFWAQVEKTTGDLFGRLQATLRAGDDSGSFLAANAANDHVLNTWGSGTTGIDTNGGAWTLTHPIPTPSFTTFPRLEFPTAVDAPSFVSVQAAAYTTRLYHLHVTAPVAFVEIAGNARLGDGSLDTSDLGSRYFCTIDRCECPKGKEGTVPPTTPLGRQNNGGVYMAVSGRPGEGTRGVIRGLSLDDFCKEKRPKPKPAKTRPIGRRPTKGKGSTNGDPHMRTGDRLAYDFQAAGEFTLVRSTTDNLEIQARQEPMLHDDSVTINSALAMNVAGDRVTVERGDPPAVRVGRRLVESSTALPRGGRIERFEDDTLITWPDGSEAIVWPVGDWGVAVSFSAAPERAGKLAGLLGNYDSNPGNDLTTRDGQTLDASIANNARATEPLYNRFGESWRISQSASLFDYERGKNTASYTNRALPKDPPTLPDWDRRVAESICRAQRITDPRLMRDCVTDVALGGDDAFAEAAAVQQAVEAQPQPPAPGQPETPIAWNHVSAFDARASHIGLGAGQDGTLHALATVRRDGDEDVIDVPIGADGGIGSASTVAAGLDGQPTVTTAPNGGLHATMPAIPPSGESGTFTFDAPVSGATWTRGAAVSTTNYAYAGYGMAAYGPGGVLLTVNTTNGYARVFRGTQPEAGEGVELAGGTSCYATSPAIASDGQAVWAAWEQFNCAQEGLFAVRIDPATGGRVGAPKQIAGSQPGLIGDTPAALTARPNGGGAWLAYADGDQVRIRRLGTGQTVDAAIAPGVGRLALSSEPGGRLWTAWQASSRLYARRTNPDATAVEAPTYLPVLPPGRTPEVTDWTVQARNGQLDLIAGGQATTNWHGAIRP